MGYLHIENLYRNQKILSFKRCYALEKVHGTSAHVAYNGSKGSEADLTFFSGGEKHERFLALFDATELLQKFASIFQDKDVTVYGEAYGGKQQGMSHTYGLDLKFIAFDVKVGETWLDVPNMADVVTKLGLEVVPWEETSTDLDTLNALRDKPSEVAIRRGMGPDKQREGVVLRPLEEMTVNNDHRVIAKHKIDRFGERNTPQEVRNVDPNKLVVLAQANEIANEWVTEERLSHVIAHLTVDGEAPDIRATGKVISAMIEDVYREAKGEIVESKEAQQAISRKASTMFRQRLQDSLKDMVVIEGGGSLHPNDIAAMREIVLEGSE